MNGSQLKAFACPACDGWLQPDPGGVSCGGCRAFYSNAAGVLDLVRRGRGRAAYDPHHFQALPRVEERHFWFVARRELILEALRRGVPDLSKRALLDVGCGSGGLLAFLERSGVPLLAACDAYPEALRLVQQRVSVPLALVDEGVLPPLAPGQSLIGLFDVLEHTDDDLGVLGRLHGSLAPGGVLILTVPAHPFLFGDRDRQACHRRRYTRSQLRQKLQAAGFEPRIVTHFMALLVPLLALKEWTARWSQRRVRRNKEPTRDIWDQEFQVLPGINGLILGLLRIENRVSVAVSLPFGSSLLAVAVRPTGVTARR